MLRFAALKFFQSLLEVEDSEFLYRGLQGLHFFLFRACRQETFQAFELELMNVASVNLLEEGRADAVAQD